jgi:hypothetical protein
VDQSLIEYFKTKTDIEEKKLTALVSYDLTDDTEYPLDQKEKEQIIDAVESLKILDPACGSGAYPIGALQKIVYILQQVDPDCTLWLDKKLQGVPDLYKQKIINEVKQNPFDYTRKLDVIKNSIFGVDIQPIAVDVSRLRCFLTLVVESEIDDSKPNRGIEPLPNLDFKFVCANTLIPLPKSEATGLFDDHSGITELSKIMSEYFSCNSHRKNELKIKFTNTQKDILEKTVSAFGKNTGELTLKLTTWNPFSNQSNSWFDPEWMFGLQDKFDVVIGNPPYITLSLGKKQAHFTPEYLKQLETLYKEVKEYKNNTFSYFIKKAFDVVNDKGIISYIVPNVLLFNKSFSRVRKLMLDNSHVVFILDIKDKVFETAEIGGNCVFVVNKNKIDNKKISNVLTVQYVEDIINPKYENLNQESFDVAPDFKFYLDSNALNVFNKIESSATCKLHELCNFYNGIKTGDNKRFIRETKQDSIDELAVRGRDIQKYKIDTPSIFVHFDKKELWSNTNEENLRKVPKILVRQTGDSIVGAIDNNGYLHMDTTHSLFDIKVDMYYLLGILNSKLISYWHRTYTSEKGRAFAEVKIANIKNIPIIERENNEIIKIVKEIISMKDKNLSTESLEDQLNDLVMEIYNLTEEEKNLIINS